MAANAKTLNREQIAIVHVAVHQLGMGDDDYRTLLASAAGVRSARDLDEAGFHAVMRRFEQLGFTSKRPKVPGNGEHASEAAQAQYGERDGMATPAQVQVIRTMWFRWYGQTEGRDGGRALRCWLENKFGVSDLRFADVTTAQKAIEGLKAMLIRQASKASRPAAPGGKP